MPSHTHAVTDPGHVHATGESGGQGFVIDSNVGGTLDIGAGAAFELALTTDTNTTGVTINSAGSGVAHTSMQPSTAVNFIVKT
jgi:microcystin-dependent protein